MRDFAGTNQISIFKSPFPPLHRHWNTVSLYDCSRQLLTQLSQILLSSPTLPLTRIKTPNVFSFLPLQFAVKFNRRTCNVNARRANAPAPPAGCSALYRRHSATTNQVNSTRVLVCTCRENSGLSASQGPRASQEQAYRERRQVLTGSTSSRVLRAHSCPLHPASGGFVGKGVHKALLDR